MDKKAERLRLYQKQYRKLAKLLSEIGFIWHGNLQRRRLPCSNTKCACKTNPKSKHGPYPYWTTKINQKTVTKLLTAEEADLYEEWIQNRRKLQSILRKMNQISKKAASVILINRKHSF